MGWYDAFSGDVARVNTSGVTSDTGNGAKAFGDAFSGFGDNLYKRELDKEKSAVLDLQKQNEQNKINSFQSDQEQKAEDWVQKEDNKDYLNEAWGATSREDFKNNYKLDDTNSVDVATLKAADAIFVEREKKAQDNFNNEAINTSVTGGYTDFKDFSTKNPELIKNADGITMSKIEKNFASKDTTSAKLLAQVKDVKHQQALLKKDKEIVKLIGSKENKEYKYSEKTDKDIVSIVAKSSGMDAPDYSMTDAKKLKFETTIAGASAIAQKYNVMPTMAVYMYNNPDKFVDGVFSPEAPQVKEEKKKYDFEEYDI